MTQRATESKRLVTNGVHWCPLEFLEVVGNKNKKIYAQSSDHVPPPSFKEQKENS